MISHFVLQHDTCLIPTDTCHDIPLCYATFDSSIPSVLLLLHFTIGYSLVQKVRILFSQNWTERNNIDLSCYNILLCMYVYYIDSPKGCKFFWKVFKVLSFYTHYTSSVPPYQPLSTGSGSILGPGISIGRTAIVVVRTPYIWSYVSVLPYRWDFGLGNRTRDMLPPVFWSPPQGAGPFFLDLQF